MKANYKRMKSSFSFLSSSYAELFTISELSEKLIHVDPSSSLSKSRLFSEKLAALIWQFEDRGFFSGNQVDRVNQLFYKNIIPEPIKDLFHAIRKSGNKATHDGNSKFSEAHFFLKKCFQLAKWFYETYDNDYLGNIQYELPDDDNKLTVSALNEQLERLSKEVVSYKEKIVLLNASPEKIEARKQRSFNNANNIGKTEAETRELIDEKLREAGWECDTLRLNYKLHKSLPEKGKNKAIAEWPCGSKWADYVLFIGTTLYGIVEAKKYAADISTDLRQSKIYAECVNSHASFHLLDNGMIITCRLYSLPMDAPIWNSLRQKAESGFWIYGMIAIGLKR